MIEAQRMWVRGRAPSAHPVLSGWIGTLTLCDPGPAGRPGILASSHGGDLILLDLPAGGAVGGPWQVGEIHAADVGDHGGTAFLAVVIGAGYLRMIDPPTGRPYSGQGGFARPRRCLVALPLPGSSLVALDGYHEVQLWSPILAINEALVTLPVEDSVWSMVASAVGGRVLLAVGTRTGQVTLWQVVLVEHDAGGPVLRSEQLAEHWVGRGPGGDRPSDDRTAWREPQAVSALSIAEFDSTPVLIAGAGRIVQGWDLSGGSAFGPVETDHLNPVVAVMVGKVGHLPVVWSSDGLTVRAWNARTGESAVAAYDIPADSSAAVMRTMLVRHQDQILVVNGYGDGVVRVFNPSIPAPSRTATPRWNDNAYPRRVGITTVGGRRTAVALLSDRTVRGFDIDNAADVQLPPIRTNLLATGDRSWLGYTDNGTLRWYDPADGSPVGAPMGAWLPDDPNAVAVADVEGRLMVVLSAGDTLLRFDALTGKQVGGPMAGHRGRIHAIAVAHSGDVPIAVSCSQDDTVRLWDLRTGRPVGSPLGGHGGGAYAVSALSTSEGQQLLFTAGRNGEVRQFDLTNQPGRFRNRQPTARGILQLGKPVQSLAALHVSDQLTLVAGSMSTVTCADVDGQLLHTMELADNVTALAAADSMVIVASGTGLYGLNLLDQRSPATPK